MNRPTISIIGLGKVGTALLKVLSSHGYQIISAVYKHTVSETLRTAHPKTKFSEAIPDALDDLGDLILITVPDDTITEVVNELDQTFPSLKTKSVAHCSGTHSSIILKPLSEKGAKIASFHPNQSITASAATFKGTWFDVEGDEEMITKLKTIADDLEAELIKIKAEQKPYLHASAVIASNYLVVLANLMTKASKLGGMNEEISLKALIPLMRNTLDNIEDNGVEDALTGPIARGDMNTVKGHIELISSDPVLSEMYKSLGREALKLSKLETTDPDTFVELQSLLSAHFQK
ncbi:Rossmann-like and DUF2520 domain-containing protein [Gracilimonas amylolytica]|uniref:Rossmann-like and DUF2520 domain-containing protein n=1 Tax=Gracilimonas amylolytica TaxID=1749045 RepID=UPI000CD976F2|nr:Rossmann-like and DUF2520 domain-containing protein [Gracilimonas amylolytica]